MAVSDPGKRARRTAGDENGFLRFVEVFDKIVDGNGGLVVLSQQQDRRRW
jgi:hypothetical protein